MSRYHSRFWSVELPAGWVGERQDGGDALYRPEGFGALHVSAIPQEQTADDGLLQYLAAEHIEAGARTYPVRFGPFSGFTLSYGAADGFWAEWYLRAGLLVLFVSYNCAPEHEALEDEVVESILATLTSSATT